jgi:alanyl-tRNA synthetase
MTERLYFSDSSLMRFSATVVDVRQLPNGPAIVLDRTAFYPTGGGQPHDLGYLGETAVLDVIDSDGTILHVIGDHDAIKVGEVVSATVDAARRLDHLQQHSGQHLLSQAFIRVCGAETKSFHLGSTASTIDMALDAPDVSLIRAAEDLANSVVFDDRPMRVHLVAEEQAARLPLRKETALEGTIRVIEVEDFDWSPCGGTHASRTGQVGLIAIRSFERAKKMTRVEFLCGRRALLDYRLANATATSVARLFSSERDGVGDLVGRVLDENKALKKRQGQLLDLALSAEAAQLLDDAEQRSGFALVKRTFGDRDAEELRVLAAKIVARQNSIALLGCRSAGAARIVFARSPSLPHHMAELMGSACAALGGRGGGRPDLAQGGGPHAGQLESIVDECAARL